MAGPIYQNVWNFTTNLTNGFLATLTCGTSSTTPLDLTGDSATMALIRQSDHLPEFTWTTGNNNITLESGGRAVINIPQDKMTPSLWITQVERYPYQIYNYTFSVYDASNVVLFGFTGTFTIFQF